jgi:hypothetical protein
MWLATEETPAAEVIAQLALDLPPDLHPWARTSGLLLLDDLLVASAAAPIGSAVSLRLVSPDPNTRYRQTTAVPFEVQKLPVQVVGGAGLKTITVWLDDAPLETLTQPPYQTWWVLSPGVHTMWAEGKREDGTLVVSEPITFAVLAPIQHSQ